MFKILLLGYASNVSGVGGFSYERSHAISPDEEWRSNKN